MVGIYQNIYPEKLPKLVAVGRRHCSKIVVCYSVASGRQNVGGSPLDTDVAWSVMVVFLAESTSPIAAIALHCNCKHCNDWKRSVDSKE